MGRAVGLFGFPLLDKAILKKSREHILNNLGVLRSGSAAEHVEIDLEPGVYIAMDSIVFVAQGGRVDALSQGLGLGSRTVFIGAADVQCRETTCSTETSEDVCGLSGSAH